MCRLWCVDAIFPEGSEIDWYEFRADVQTVIETMRQPNAAMLMAVAPFPVDLVTERRDASYTKNQEIATAVERLAARSIYQAMIDAALRQN